MRERDKGRQVGRQTDTQTERVAWRLLQWRCLGHNRPTQFAMMRNMKMLMIITAVTLSANCKYYDVNDDDNDDEDDSGGVFVESMMTTITRTTMMTVDGDIQKR